MLDDLFNTKTESLQSWGGSGLQIELFLLKVNIAKPKLLRQNDKQSNRAFPYNFCG